MRTGQVVVDCLLRTVIVWFGLETEQMQQGQHMAYTDPSKQAYRHHSFTRVAARRMHLFTLLQLASLAVAWLLNGLAMAHALGVTRAVARTVVGALGQ